MSAGNPDGLTCETCGETPPGEAQFCSNCGASLQGDAPAAPPKEGRPWVWVVVVGVLLLGSCLAVSFMAANVISGWRAARRAGNETAAIGALRTLASVQEQYAEETREVDRGYAASLAELSAAGLIDNVLGAGIKSGYRFGLSGSTQEWLATATPVSESTGRRNFIVCTDGVIRYSGEAPATCSSRSIQ